MTRAVKNLSPGVRRALIGVLAVSVVVALGAVLVAVLDDDEEPAAAPRTLPSRTVESTPTLEARPVAMDVRVGRVFGGKLPRARRQTLERQVGKLVGRYFESAYLGGDYPRRDFGNALAGFSSGAAARARSDRAILSNAAVGARTDGVAARTKKVRLDVVLANRRNDVVGVTARIRLVFLQGQVEGADQRVMVTGRLMLAKRKGAWEIFGYDVARNATPAGKGGTR